MPNWSEVQRLLEDISSGWKGYTDTSHDDWHYALGSFSYEVREDLWLGPEDDSGNRPIQIRYQAIAADTYNFNPSSAFSRFELLATDGWAAEFWDMGQTSTFTDQTTLSGFNVNGLGIPLP